MSAPCHTASRPGAIRTLRVLNSLARGSTCLVVNVVGAFIHLRSLYKRYYRLIDIDDSELGEYSIPFQHVLDSVYTNSGDGSELYRYISLLFKDSPCASANMSTYAGM